MGRYALLIGTADYVADPHLSALPSARHDVHQMKAVLDQAGRFDDVSAYVDLPAQLFVRTVEDFYGARRPGDLALFYYSGHGVKHADNQSVFLAASDTVTSGLHATAFDTDGQLRHLLNHTKATHKVVFLDCCFSGSFSARARLSGGMRAEPRRGKHEQGTFILTSSTHLQASKVQGPDEPSVFTEVLLDGLRGGAEGGEDGWLTTSELSRYTMAEMARRRRHEPVESSEGVTEAARLVLTAEVSSAVDPAVGVEETTTPPSTPTSGAGCSSTTSRACAGRPSCNRSSTRRRRIPTSHSPVARSRSSPRPARCSCPTGSRSSRGKPR
jgi:uncharacterized caspase-like protein